jgi:hypothetical protein
MIKILLVKKFAVNLHPSNALIAWPLIFVMNKTFTVIEKIIGCLITVWGMVTLYSVTSIVYNVVSSGIVSSGNMSYLSIVAKNQLNIILSIAAIFGGFYLLNGEKNGWLTSIICSIVFSISFFISATINKNNVKQTDLFFYQSYSLTGILLAAMAITLLLKPYRLKYQPTKSNTKWAAIIIGLLLIDKIIFG